MHPPAIRLLASTNNARGDLFTRLVKDLFFALGYDDLRLDVAKSGREIDLRATHRFEPREIIAECKAEKDPIGGRDANTFLGVLTRERDKTPETPLHGYFVSLSGFPETEVEQELQTSAKNRIILLTGSRVVEELERSRVLIRRTDAIERAGRCVESAGVDASLDGTELLGHAIGYVWAVFYSQGKERTHLVLVHADGTPLAESVAREVMQADRNMKGSLHKLQYLLGPKLSAETKQSTETAIERYRQWLGEECGFIQLDGLPADTDLSATRMKLERLFVPLNVVIPSEKVNQQGAQERILPIGQLLEKTHRLALVAKPGGGKSTLLKRLAVAYAFPDRRTESADELPDREWLPLFLRCRDLRNRIQWPIVDLLDGLAGYAGMNTAEAALFQEHVHNALRSRNALLLVDGLDEISDEGARQTFAQNLRTFVAMFPNVALIVTSREAGFRLVAGVIASVCTKAQLAPFGRDDVAQLCERWHIEVVANTEKVRAEARGLAEAVWDNERIRALAENPLMLTTLLVVRRCIGELPTGRVQLYREAVRVLIRTWNTEGFAPLNLEEALAQLSYVACSMTEAGQQQIGQKGLIRLLRQARTELSPELDFTQTSPEQFIERIEYRSSLLMQTGYSRIDDELQPVYEFRHLTFQEYLTARGLVEEQYPGRNQERPLVDLLETHFNSVQWREIIPLAAVLAGRKADPLIQRLTAAARNSEGGGDIHQRTAAFALHQCLLDEVQVSGVTLRAALDQTARRIDDELRSTTDLYRGKFGTLFKEIVETAYLNNSAEWWRYLYSFSDQKWLSEDRELLDERATSLNDSLLSNDRLRQARAASTCNVLAFSNSSQWVPTLHGEDLDIAVLRSLAARFLPLRESLAKLVSENDLPIAALAAWALAWTGGARLPNSPPTPETLLSLYRLWRTQSGELQRFAGWAFERQPLSHRDMLRDSDLPKPDTETESYVLAWYLRKPWGDAELLERLSLLNGTDNPTIFEILRTFGSAGEPVIRDLVKKSAHGAQLLRRLDI